MARRQNKGKSEDRQGDKETNQRTPKRPYQGLPTDPTKDPKRNFQGLSRESFQEPSRGTSENPQEAEKPVLPAFGGDRGVGNFSSIYRVDNFKQIERVGNFSSIEGSR